MADWHGVGIVAVVLGLGVGAVQAQPTAAPLDNVVHLSAQASLDVPRDWITVVLSTQREGPQAAAVQSQLKEALDAALGQARALAREATRQGDIEVRTGNFSLMPRYSGKGAIQLWSGRAELIVEGRDMSAIAALAGRIDTLTVQRVQHALSLEARRRVEDQVLAEAVARFRARAAEAAKLFGFTGHVLREVHLGQSDGPEVVPMAYARGACAAAMSAEPLPTEAGQATVRVVVNGSVQLTR